MFAGKRKTCACLFAKYKVTKKYLSRENEVQCHPHLSTLNFILESACISIVWR